MVVTDRETPGRTQQKETAMYYHPSINEACAANRRRNLIAQADAWRLARSIRNDRPAEAKQAARAKGRLHGVIRVLRPAS